MCGQIVLSHILHISSGEYEITLKPLAAVWFCDIITSDKLSAETRQKIESLFTDDSEGSTVHIDDVNIMSKILENAMLDEVSISTNTVFKFGNNYPFTIQVNFKNNTQSNLVYPDGKFPLELLVNIILGSNQ